MSREDLGKAPTCHQECIEQGTLKIALLDIGIKLFDTRTSADYKVTNGVFDKRNIRLCICNNYQEEEKRCDSGNLHAPVMRGSTVTAR